MKKGIGVYIGRKEILAASISIAQGVPVLEKYAVEAIRPTGTEAAPAKKKEIVKKELTLEAQAVQRVLLKMGGINAPVIAAFNPFNLVTRYFEIPFVPPKERREAARYEATRYIPFKMDETISDFHIVGRKSKTGENILGVTCAAARIDILRSYVQHLRQAGAKVDMVEPVFSALARTLSVTEKGLEAGTHGFIFIDGEESVNVTLVNQGMVYLSRDFLLSADDKRGSETRFYEELKASFEYMKKVSGEEKIRAVFLAGSGELLFWRDFLSGVFGAEYRFEIGSFPVSGQNIPVETLPSLLLPIGLALRRLNVRSYLGDLTLLPPLERETKPEKIKKTIQIDFLIIAILFILVRLAILNPYAAYVEKKVLSQISPEAAQDPQFVSMPLPELVIKRNEQQTIYTQIGDLVKSRVLLGKKLKSISNTMPRAVWLEHLLYASANVSGLTGQGAKQMTLGGQCYLANAEEDVKAIDGWIKALNQDKEFLEGFKKITVTEVRREKYLDRDTTMFSILCQ